MALDQSFRYAHLLQKAEAEAVSKGRKVRTPAGAKYFNAPIGTPITPGMRAAAKKRNPKGTPAVEQKAQMKAGDHTTTAGKPKAAKVSDKAINTREHPDYQKRLAEYDLAIDKAKTDKDYAKIIQAVQADSLLNDDDYNKVLDAVENALDGNRVEPLARDIPSVPKQGKIGGSADKDANGYAADPKNVGAGAIPQAERDAAKKRLDAKKKREAAAASLKNPPKKGVDTKAAAKFKRDAEAEIANIQSKDGLMSLLARVKEARANGEIDSVVRDDLRHKMFDRQAALQRRQKAEAGNKARIAGELEKRAQKANGDRERQAVQVDADFALRNNSITDEQHDRIVELLDRNKNASKPNKPNTRLKGIATKARERAARRDPHLKAIAAAKGQIELDAAYKKALADPALDQRDHNRMAERVRARSRKLAQFGPTAGPATKKRLDAEAAKKKAAAEQIEYDELKGRIDKLKADGVINDKQHKEFVDVAKKRYDKAVSNKRPDPKALPGLNDQLNGARNEADVNAVVDRLEGPEGADLTDDEYNFWADAVDARMDAVLNPPKPGGVDKQINDLVLDAHFANGGDAFDAPQAGLFAYVKDNPKRFNAKRFSKNGNISDSYRVIDQKTGAIFFMKDTGGGEDGAGKEMMAAAAGNVLGFFDHRARLGQAPGNDGGNNVLIEAAIQPGEDLKGLGELSDAKQTEIAKDIGDGKNPESLMEMILFDFLIANDEDRHRMNMHVAKTKDGWKAVILDHGRAFGGARSRLNDRMYSQTFDEWFREYENNSARGWSPGKMMKNAYENNYGYESNFQKIIGRFDGKDLEKMIDKVMKESGMEGTADAPKYRALMETRLKHITDAKNQQSIIKALVNAKQSVY